MPLVICDTCRHMTLAVVGEPWDGTCYSCALNESESEMPPEQPNPEDTQEQVDNAFRATEASHYFVDRRCIKCKFAFQSKHAIGSEAPSLVPCSQCGSRCAPQGW